MPIMSNHINCIEDKLKKIYDIISSLNKEAYKDIFLLSNQVLSKNPLTNNLLNRYLASECLKKHSFCIIIIKLLRYYKYSLKEFILYIVRFIEYSFTPLNFHLSPCNKELILIDTYFITNKIYAAGGYADPYFPGLEDVLKKKNKHYAYLPVFYSSDKTVSFSNILRILKENRIPVFSEYQLLSNFDLLYILYFIFVYPYHVIKLIKIICSDTYEKKLLKYELIDTLEQVTFCSFSRYIQGKKIATLPYGNIKVISWYENQAIHKNLYKGLRISQDKVKIYGAQLFVYFKNILHLIPDENEEQFGIIPDKIITNNSKFIPAKSRLNYAVGPSLRYFKIFETTVKKENRKNILVLLPYMIKDVQNILQIILDTKINSQDIFIKAHPATSIDKFQPLFPKNITVVNEDIYKLFENTKIVIGAASGTLLEAATLGIPVILIRNINTLDCNPLPEYGKGLIWEEVISAEELNYQIYKFENVLNNNYEKIYNIANIYKKKFFHKPSENNIIDAFDL